MLEKINEASVIFLMILSSILGVKEYPQNNQDWKVIKTWDTSNQGYFEFSAVNQNISNQCKSNPSFYIEAPPIIHSYSQFRIKNRILSSFGDKNFKHIRGFYGILIIPCSEFAGQETLIWEVISYSKYFSRFHYFPKITNSYPKKNFFNETLNVICAGIFLTLGILYLILFSKKISNEKLISLVLANFFTSIYFIENSAGLAALNVSMLTAHKIADSGLWLGFVFLMNFYKSEQLILPIINQGYRILVTVSLVIIAISINGDSIQFGTTIPFFPTLILMTLAIWKLLHKNDLRLQVKLLQFIALTLSLIAYFNDAFMVLGILDSVPISSIGWVISHIFILFSVNESITSTYVERDRLKLLTNQLEEANQNLRKTQDELIKSEKMAVMGRAVSRIAHELNTPIYLVRSSVQNIVTQTKNFSNFLNKPNQEQISSVAKQFENDLNKMAKSLTISVSKAAELVKRFKEISSDEPVLRKKEFKLLDYITKSVMAMESDLNKSAIEVKIKGDEVQLNSDSVLFHQIIQNFITNTQKYAYETGGLIEIEVTDLGEKIKIRFCDFGKGISEENLPKIFDPFFTTGGGSGGTGLGLNIVYRIVTIQLKGEISCESKPNSGTSFTIIFPK